MIVRQTVPASTADWRAEEKIWPNAHIGDVAVLPANVPLQRDWLRLAGQHEASHRSGRAVQIIEQRSCAYSGSLAPEMH